MNIALMSHDNKKELMVQFCIAYCGILSKHTVCATSRTGRLVAEATGLPVQLFMAHAHGGAQQIGARIAYNEIDRCCFSMTPMRRIWTRTCTISPACATRTMCPLPPMQPPPRCSSTAWPGAT